MNKIAYSYCRFSSAVQATGHSLARQTERARKWAEENGYTLDTTLDLKDLGVSAWRGKNATEGALGQFLSAVEQGRVEQGSALIVESLDRLSRDHVIEASALLSKIVRAGIEVVSLIDGQRYCREMDLGQILHSIISFALANEESQKKSDRVGRAWENKKKLAISEKKPLTPVMPRWLKIDGGRIVEIPDRAAIVREIFRMAAEGTGTSVIASTLAERGVPPWGLAKGKTGRDHAVWHKSYIQKILHNESVTGVLTITRLTDGKRYSAEKVEGYFPVTVSVAEFKQTADAMKSRRQHGGRTGKASNLFPHLTRCGYCGASIVHTNKGANSYLVCGSSRFGECKYHSVTYPPVEKAILNYCGEIDISTILAPDRKEEISIKRNLLAGITAEFDKAILARDRVSKALELQDTGSDGFTHLASRVGELSNEIRMLKEKIESVTSEIKTASGSEVALKRQLDEMADLVAVMDGQPIEDRIKTRKLLKGVIARSIKKITLFPDGLHDNQIVLDGRKLVVEKWSSPYDLDDILRMEVEEPDKVEAARAALALEASKWGAENTGRNKASFLIEFANGHTRLFAWDKAHRSFEVDSQTTASGISLGGKEIGVESWEYVTA